MNLGDAVVAAVCDGVHAIAVWDASWSAFNDCYLVRGPQGAVMVDCGKAEHAEAVVGALRQLGLDPRDVVAVLATHGHADHVGGAAAFPRARRLIHPIDLPRLPEGLRALFEPGLPDEGEVLGFQVRHIPHYTEGSVALFAPDRRALFCGDHVCFFGGSLPPEGLVGTAAGVREELRRLVAEWFSDPEARQRRRVDLFRQGLQRLLGFDAEYLCTGHGPVLRGGVRGFLRALLEAADGAAAVGPPG